jgi:hypothetical protein
VLLDLRFAWEPPAPPPEPPTQGPWRKLDGGIAEKRRRLANEDNDDLALYDLGVIGKLDA